ncbi:MAG: FHA domain-containing protein [Lentisphaerae bacterium]|nr:MAG: FHA domain-containing protein [Lentisphaerota bacterium]
MGKNPKLIVLSEQLRGQVFELEKDRYRVGRRDDMDICLVDPTVSSLHCELVRNEDGGYTAVDEGYSTNGTRVNGMLITRHKLVNSDLLQVGGVECMYDADPESLSSVLSTQNLIKIDDSTISANTRSNLAPENFRSEASTRYRTIFRVVIGILVVSIMILLFLLISNIFSAT